MELGITEFPVTTPPILTHVKYVAFLRSLPVHPSCLYFASEDDNVEEVKRILRKNPNLDVNWKNESRNDFTALIRACDEGHDSIVSIFLAHPAIDVNLKSVFGETPFAKACGEGHTSCVRLLLKDSRVEVNEPGITGRTPLWDAAGNGHVDVMKWWIASGREIDLGTPGHVDTDVIGEAKYQGDTKVVAVLERFPGNPEETRHKVRLEIEWYNEAAAEMFALVVFVSDELLQIKDTIPTPAARFFNIARRLPLELQMVLCHRVVGSPKEIIRAQDREVAFKSLAESLLWASFFASG